MSDSNPQYKSIVDAVREGEYIIKKYLLYRGWVVGSKVLPIVGASTSSKDCDTWVLILQEDRNGRAYHRPRIATADSIYAAASIQEHYEVGAI